MGEVEDRLHVNVTVSMSDRLITESSDGYFYTCYNLGKTKRKVTQKINESQSQIRMKQQENILLTIFNVTKSTCCSIAKFSAVSTLLRSSKFAFFKSSTSICAAEESWANRAFNDVRSLKK